MNTFTREEDINAMSEGLGKCLQHIYANLDVVAIRCALELHIVDIINNHGAPISLAQIAHGINSSSLNIDGLSRLMTFLVHKKIFDQVQQREGEEPLYALNHCSSWLLKNTVAPLVMALANSLFYSQFDNLSKSILEGGTATKKTFGVDLWDFLSVNPDFNNLFNEGMACRTRITMDVIMSKYKFDGLQGTLVDVGGGLGGAINDIVTAHPHLKGINFELPHVISTAPTYEGVTHVGGDMFKAIPPTDSILLKSVLHDWGDKECIQILKNCWDSVHAKKGKVIIVDIVLNHGRDDAFKDTRIAQDLMMLSFFETGKERTEVEWKKILEKAGFYRYNIINIPAIESIIEAYSD